ncbi:MAG: signal peptidase II [Deltaproteobacteria bacterium]|jgi:signal peptidase II|nr:signal peptidase II [Deltaproteobacteria bacterium]MBT4090170.1 signal peptidase II [Deltaproteobacteria bacterium]MBT4265758.1 signal peptidase II [Deltaproteobacteria bacterium]MBT4640281.1 signal peptidase II [Deltaproteobacteria bacterium]MBT6500250.1 signal peptidase II [Deltaproteobacteria bacterium]
MKYYLTFIAVFIGLDQLLKFTARLYLQSGSYIELIPNLIDLTLQENQGISFSLLSDLPSLVRVPLLAGISLIVVVGLCIYVFRNWTALVTGEKLGFSLIISGAVGNLIDRVVRQQVTDYMYFHFYDTGFFVNNLADDLITIGFLIMVYQAFVIKKVDS